MTVRHLWSRTATRPSRGGPGWRWRLLKTELLSKGLTLRPGSR